MPSIGKILNVGCGRHVIPHTVPVDKTPGIQEATVVWDADTGESMPFFDETIAGIHCYHMLEHVEDPLWVISEFDRVLAEWGTINIVVPYYMGGMAFQDLNHKHFFTEDTWRILFQNDRYDTMFGVADTPVNLSIQFNMVMGDSARTLALVTQLRKGAFPE